MTSRIKRLAAAHGFAAVGVAPALPVPRCDLLRYWLEMKWHGNMSYMDRGLDLRMNPALLVPGARSVICLATAYPLRGEQGRIASYARGRDYHKVIKQQCIRLMDAIRQFAPGLEGRAFVDSAPVMERTLAVLAGLGWIGRNGCLAIPQLGSGVLLCEIISNLDLVQDSPIISGCDDCGRCVAACPTGAIGEMGLVDARRCISYLTIEHVGLIDPAFWPMIGSRLFGCDACQQACPANCAANSLGDGDAGSPDLAEILAWGEQQWDAATAGTALRRASYAMLMRNAVIAAGNSGRRELADLIGRLQDHYKAVGVEGLLIEWALVRLSQAVD